MSTIAPGSKVLVTGANGFIARWVIRLLLERGYTVRGSVRSQDKALALKTSFASFGDKFETVIVEDMANDGAFDDAVVGVDAIEHTASPCHVHAEDPEEVIKPAVGGTVGILKSILKNNPNIKRVVITASCSSIVEDLPEPKNFTEEDWNEQCLRTVKEQGRAASGLMKYRASKTLAEKAAWAFVEEHKQEISWDLTVIHPPYVFGPVDRGFPSTEPHNTSISQILQILFGLPSTDVSPAGGLPWVDVRDLCEIHVRSLEVPDAGGERILVVAGAGIWQDWVDAANALSPPVTLPPGVSLSVGEPGVANNNKVSFDVSKADRLFGIKYRDIQDTVRAVLEDVARRAGSGEVCR